MEKLPKLITAKQAAVILGIGVKQIYRLIDEGQLPFYNYNQGNPGKRAWIRLTRTSVEDFQCKSFVASTQPVKSRH